MLIEILDYAIIGILSLIGFLLFIIRLTLTIVLLTIVGAGLGLLYLATKWTWS